MAERPLEDCIRFWKARVFVRQYTTPMMLMRSPEEEMIDNTVRYLEELQKLKCAGGTK